MSEVIAGTARPLRVAVAGVLSCCLLAGAASAQAADRGLFAKRVQVSQISLRCDTRGEDKGRVSVEATADFADVRPALERKLDGRRIDFSARFRLIGPAAGTRRHGVVLARTTATGFRMVPAQVRVRHALRPANGAPYTFSTLLTRAQSRRVLGFTRSATACKRGRLGRRVQVKVRATERLRPRRAGATATPAQANAQTQSQSGSLSATAPLFGTDTVSFATSMTTQIAAQNKQTAYGTRVATLPAPSDPLDGSSTSDSVGIGCYGIWAVDERQLVEPFNCDTSNHDASTSTVSADVNRDGYTDSLVADQSADVVRVSIWPFLGALQFSMNGGVGASDPVGVATGDVNDDGWPDWVTTDGESNNPGLTNALNTTQNNAWFAYSQVWGWGGSFGNSGSGAWGAAITMGDYNQDGLVDVATATGEKSSSTSPSQDQMLATFLNTGQNANWYPGGGQFWGPVAVPLNDSNDIVTADFNQDGLPDVAQTMYDQDSAVVVYTNSPSAPGQFNATTQSKITTTTNQGATFLTAGDVNDDALPDIVAVADGNFNVYLNQTTPGAALSSFSLAQTFGADGGTPDHPTLGNFGLASADGQGRTFTFAIYD